MVGCSGNAHYIMDSFEGHLLAKLEGHVGLERRKMTVRESMEPSKGISGEEVCWTPDSKFVLSGSLDGRVVVWDVQNLPTKEGPLDLKAPPVVLQPVGKLEGHPGPSRCIRFNPRCAMMCTAGQELVRVFIVLLGFFTKLTVLQAFWLPDMSADPDEAAKELLKKKSQGPSAPPS